MKLVIISDTHRKHDLVHLPEGDVLIHCGDVSGMGTEREIREFASWFDRQEFDHKLVIAGNHDQLMSSQWFRSATYLQDESITIDGIKIWGSPWTPTFFDWWWMLDAGPEIAKKWALIPQDTDVLITHGPPRGILDKTLEGDYVGCEELLRAVKRVNPKIHCFGHIHEGYGMMDRYNTCFINASTCTRRYIASNPPVEVEI